MIKRKFFLLISCFLSITIMDLLASENDPSDNVITRQIGIGPAGVIMEADSIVANLTVWENDTLPPKVLSPCMCSVVKYTLCQPVMYSSDKRVYSAFYADAHLIIYKGDAILTLELDYNINKWRLMDGKGKQICRHDLKNSELLSMIHELWPDSKNINIKYEKFVD